MICTVSEQFYFREVRKSVPAGGTVELDDSLARRYMTTHPGLLKPALQNTQGAPKAVRSKEGAPKAAKEAAKPKGDAPAAADKTTK